MLLSRAFGRLVAQGGMYLVYRIYLISRDIASIKAFLMSTQL